MMDSQNKQPKRRGLLMVLLAAGLSSIAPSGIAQTPEESIVSHLKQLCSVLNDIGGFRLSATSHFTLEPKYLEINPNIDPNKYGRVEEEYTVSTNGKLFRIETQFRLQDGELRIPIVCIFDGSDTMLKFSEGKAMAVKKGVKRVPDNSMPLGTVLYMPFGFLLPCEDEKIAILTPSTLNDQETWSSFTGNMTVESVKSSTETNLRVNQGNGAYCIVKLSLPDLLPKAYELYSREGKKQLSYETIAQDVVHYNGASFPYAKEFVLSFYVEGFKRSQRLVSIGKIEMLKNLDEDFAADPASVDVIFDEDTKESVRVSK